MTITTVLNTNTFDEWRTRTNQLITQSNFYEGAVPDLYLRSNSINVNVTATFAQVNALALSANAYTNSVSVLTGSGANLYSDSVSNRANNRMDAGGAQANVTALAYATTASQSSNNFLLATLLGANTLMLNTIAGANIAVGNGANAAMQRTLAGANTAVGNGANANAWLTIVGVGIGLSAGITGANANAANATYLTTGITALARGGTGASTPAGARTNLELGALATRNSVNGTQIVIGSDAQGDILYRNASEWVRLPAGNPNQVLRTKGSGQNPTWSNNMIDLGGGSGATGPYIDFTNIPSNVNRVNILFYQVSSSLTTDIVVQIGSTVGSVLDTPGSYESTCSRSTVAGVGTSSVDTSANSTGFIINRLAASDAFTGTMTLNRLPDSGVWISTVLGRSHFGTSNGALFGGGVNIGAAVNEIKTIRVKAASGALDAGSVYLTFE